MRTGLRAGLHAYRQLGPRQGTKAVARRLTQAGRGPVRRFWLQRRPLVVGPAELRAALGRLDFAAALAQAANALRSVRRWLSELDDADANARADLLRRAEDILAHRFDLLGSGPTELGPQIDWHRDFKSGRVWPLEHVSRIVVSYPDNSDIKVPWELSRCQHLPLLAAAYRLTGERRYLDELGAQLHSWIDANPVEFGVNWACTMDVAIRAANWLAALIVAISESPAPPWLDEVLASLLLHCRFIRSHLELGQARGNHYLSDVVGLLVVSSLFAGSEEGRGWSEWAVRELGHELRHQIRADGCDHEASTSYHRLVAELFIVGADAAQALAPEELDPEVAGSIERMLAFVADYTRPDGLAPQLGDADDGRLLPLGDYGSADQRDHLHLFRLAQRRYEPATCSASYPHGGFFFMRAGDIYVAVRCGDVGIHGRGCHAHNDLLGFELCRGATPLIVDPGSYLYTADPLARNQFRSTAVHSSLQIDGAEQNELREDRLFAMVDRARPELLEFDVSVDAVVFRGRHHGFEALPEPATHARTLRLDGARRTLEVIDEVISDGAHDLAWTFQLAPCEVELSGGEVLASFGESGVLRLEIAELAASVEQGWLSQSYGVRIPAPALRLRGRSAPGEHRTVITLEL